MSPYLAERVVDGLDKGLPGDRTIILHLYGGEPLTNLPALRALLLRSQQKQKGRFRFAITTNGSILSEEVMSILSQGEFEVVLSIDGPPEIHDRCRRTVAGEPTQARVLALLYALREQTKCHVRGSAVVRSGWRLAQAEEFLRSLPVDCIKAQAIRAPENSPYLLSLEERQLYLHDLEAVGEQVITELEQGWVPRDDRFSSRVLQLLIGYKRSSFCGAGNTIFGITPEGQVLPCILLEPENHLLGSIMDDSAAWRQAGLEWRTARQAHWAGSQCDSCTYFSLCGGGCPVMSSICGADECELTKKNCEIATNIYLHFKNQPEKLLLLAGIT
jgi:uncharacterized protein